MTAPNDNTLIPELFSSLASARSDNEFDRAALGAVCRAAATNSAQLWCPTPPHWTSVAYVGEAPQAGPPEAVFEALDRDSSATLAGWSACCLSTNMRTDRAGQGTTQPDLLAIRASIDPALLSHIGEVFSTARTLAHQLHGLQRRSLRLEELLSISFDWAATSDIGALLDRMAESASRLFGSDRATIFLWDRSTSQLVGRPALGMADGRLVIPEDRGVVGAVVQSGEPRRTTPHDHAAEADRTTDAETGYQTKSLLCVPLDTPGGERLGAFELINKLDGQFTDDDQHGLIEFAHLAAAALATAQQVEELVERRDSLVEQAASGVRMLGECAAIAALRKTIDRVADADLAVLVLGENGTGKEVVAQSIHFRSPRRNEPLLAVNCAAIAETLLESELFGHEAGAFTDARESRAGKFELADGGTILLDEIGDMSPGGQAKLLRVLEDKTVVRVGGAEPRKVDVRVIAATNRDLLARVREGKFREDLYYRLNVVTLELPPLRERDDDILLLGQHFLSGFCSSQGRKPPRFSADARRRLLSHPWPGNVRELRNIMERVAYLTEGPTVKPEELGLIAPVGETPSGEEYDAGLAEATRQFQRDHITRAIDREAGNVTAAATGLGVHRSNLYRKMRQLGMSVDG